MRANVPDEIIELIDEKITLDLEIHMLNTRYTKAEKSGKTGFATYLDGIIKEKTKQRHDLGVVMRDKGIKVFEPVSKEGDFEFVQYPYTVKSEGGFKEGEMYYWRAALKLKLKKRTAQYFKKE